MGSVGIGAGKSAKKLLIGNVVLIDCEARLNDTAVVVSGVLGGMATAWRFVLRIFAKSEWRR